MTLDNEIMKEIMRLHNCCENRAKDIMNQFDISSKDKLDDYIRLMSTLILNNAGGKSNVPANTL